MSSRYFDVEAWEREKAAEHAKRKREEEMGVSSSKQITKKDMVCPLFLVFVGVLSNNADANAGTVQAKEGGTKGEESSVASRLDMIDMRLRIH